MKCWEDVKGYENLYKVSSKGSIYSVRRHNHLSQNKDGKGYYRVTLSYNGKHTTKKVHRLVAEAFIPNPENKPQVNHKDGNKLNNAVNNLEWATNGENSKHAFDMGLKHMQRGEDRPSSKLTVGDVKEIRNLYATGMYSQRKLAEMYKINQTNVGFIVRMETWKDV